MKFIENLKTIDYAVLAKFKGGEEFEIFRTTCEIDALNFYNTQINTLAFNNGLISDLKLLKTTYTEEEYKSEVIEEDINTNENEIKNISL